MNKVLLLLSLLHLVLCDNALGTVNSGTDAVGVDLPGMPVAIWATSAPIDCQWKCHLESKCVAWAYDSCHKDKCWLKGSVSGSVADKCRASGTMIGRVNPPSPSNSSCIYRQAATLTGQAFLDSFDFFTGPDPTHGSVKFLSAQDAARWGLTRVNSDGSVYLGVDNSNKLYDGRSSLRLSSKKAFKTGLLVADLAHIPDNACGVWPSLWTTGPNWPQGGEIDIIEGVNQNARNQISLHTGGACSIPDSAQKGSKIGSDCQVSHGTAGCGILTNSNGAFGTGFNRNGGGAYAMERSPSAIKVWFFPKGSYPASLLTSSPNVCEFGTPEASFPLTGQCNQAQFGPQTIIIDTTFCGDWADAPGVYSSAGCPGKCADFVANNPQAFNGTFWQFKSLRLYQ